MELRDYLRIARRRWLLILLTTVAAVGVAALVTSAATPMYQSSARVFVSTGSSSSSSDAYQGGLFSQQRVASYVDVINGEDVARRVVQDLKLSESPSTLASRITATVVPNTVLLEVAVQDPNRFEAQRINNALMLEIRSLVSDLETPPGRRVATLKATVVDAPQLPTSPVSPQPARNLGLALVLGLLLGFGLAVARELFDATVKDLDDLPALAETPVLSGLSYDPQVFGEPLISNLPSHSPRVEAFRVLRTNMEFLDVDSTSKVFVVSSSVPGEGKSTTATNAALAFASAGREVLLVDGDMRRPQVAHLLGLVPDVGLTTVLTGQADLADAVQRHSETGLAVLTAGAIPPNPAELLQSRAMQVLLNELRSRYDVVIIDAPPLLPVTDAALIASESDGAVVVVRHGRTTRDQLRGAAERLQSVDAPLLGVVFNMIPLRGSGYGYGYGYGYGPTDDASPSRSTLTWRQRRDRRREQRRSPRKDRDSHDSVDA
ncbi:polysaccharide biosynthesis tyrosine autokinase [Nocardioides korecus]